MGVALRKIKVIKILGLCIFFGCVVTMFFFVFKVFVSLQSGLFRMGFFLINLINKHFLLLVAR